MLKPNNLFMLVVLTYNPGAGEVDAGRSLGTSQSLHLGQAGERMCLKIINKHTNKQIRNGS